MIFNRNQIKSLKIIQIKKINLVKSQNIMFYSFLFIALLSLQGFHYSDYFISILIINFSLQNTLSIVQDYLLNQFMSF